MSRRAQLRESVTGKRMGTENGQNYIMINQLNEDCLIEIFQYLPVVDRLRVEIVCKKWQRVCNILWRAHRRLDFTDEYLCFGKPSGEINFRLFKIVFTKCASHVVDLNPSTIPKKIQRIIFNSPLDCYSAVHFYTTESISQDMRKILMRCCNIQELTLDSSVILIDKMFLLRLLRKNANIRFLRLEGYAWKDKSAFQISLDNLESLTLVSCNFNVEFPDLQMLRQPSKLKNLCLDGTWPGSEIALDQVLSKSLVQLRLSRPTILISMPREVTEMVNLDRLKVLSVADLAIDDVTLGGLVQHCKGLKALDLTRCYEVTDIGLRRINSSLPDLVCLNIDWGNQFTDYGLGNINENLRVLSATGSQFTAAAIGTLVEEADFLEKLDLGESPRCHPDESEILLQYVSEAMELRLRGSNPTPLEIGVFHEDNPERAKYTIPDLNLELNFDIFAYIDYSSYINL